jgi:D-glycerate 3-kinase
MDFKPFLTQEMLNEAYLVDALKWFKPLGDHIAAHHDGAGDCFYIGVNGAQGSGKSTFSAFIAYYLNRYKGKRCVVLSLDDFYLSQSDRLELSVKAHPLLRTRGVPGTHDVNLIAKTLKRLNQYGTLSIPRFDKATDNPKPVNEWPIVNTPVDVVIFEGWCWGVSPQTPTDLLTPINKMEYEHDELGKWRDYVNHQLGTEYQGVQEMMDYWVMLKAPSFACVEAWRVEQEHKLRARYMNYQAHNSTDIDGIPSAIMTDEQIKSFIMLFQRLTQHSLTTLPAKADCVYELDQQRRILSSRANFYD